MVWEIILIVLAVLIVLIILGVFIKTITRNNNKSNRRSLTRRFLDACCGRKNKW